MPQSNSDYYAMRAEQEDAAADNAASPPVAAIHRTLAAAYMSKCHDAAWHDWINVAVFSSAGPGGDEDHVHRIAPSGSGIISDTDRKLIDGS